MNRLVTLFVNREPTALLLDIKDKGTEYLERTLPAHVKVFYHFEDMPQSEFKLIIAVTPYIYSAEIPMLCFHPAVLHLGIGCRETMRSFGHCGIHRSRDAQTWFVSVLSRLPQYHRTEKKTSLCWKSSTGDGPTTETHIYPAEELKDITVPHPSERHSK